MRDANPFQRRLGAPARFRRPSPGAHGRHLDILAHREVLEEFHDLECAGQPERAIRYGGQPAISRPAMATLPLVILSKPGDQVDQWSSCRSHWGRSAPEFRRDAGRS